ncbi:MAG: peptidylprolyl isomerase [Planctomycetes bacterium]|nr:peptidylprolyl isomerase [Planctomycetota bacterium]
MRSLLIATLAAAGLAGCASPSPRDADTAASLDRDKPLAVFEIARGDETWGRIVFELDPASAPITVANFLQYVDESYFDGTLIHRVLVAPGARIQIFQGGGYTVLNGPSKPGQHPPIKLETATSLKNERGTISMARDAAPDTATSEYFVNVEANHRLDYQSAEKPGYAAFGRIVSGWDVVERISRVAVREYPDPELKGEISQPIDPPLVRRAFRLKHGQQ